MISLLVQGHRCHRGCQIEGNFFDEHLAIMEPRGSISEDGLPRGTATLIDCRPANAWNIQIYHAA
jgi:hypothetical protein